MYKSFSKLVNA